MSLQKDEEHNKMNESYDYKLLLWARVLKDGKKM